MNASLIRASNIRRIMQLKGSMEGNPNHQAHIQDYCNYADAVAKGEADSVRLEMPSTVASEVQKQMNSNKV